MEKQHETWTVLKVLNWTKSYLADKGIENARLESEWMLCEALGLDRVGLYVNFDRPMSVPELTRFREMVARRAKREPLQHILGSQEFMGLDFGVSPAALIPRHDTEVLVEEALKHCPRARTILDVGVGSGCVAVALARSIPTSRVFGVDSSPEALDVAAGNAARNGVSLQLFDGSMFEPVTEMRFDLIVSNPPYIATADIEALQPEVRDFEPRQALDGGIDGLDFYRAMVPAAPAYLNDGGWLMFEVGVGQSRQVMRMFETADCYDSIFFAKDPGGIERVVGARLAQAVCSPGCRP
jgi:release factor glutamine methyltransferase